MVQRALFISSRLIAINKVKVFLQEVYQESCLYMISFNHVYLGISEAVSKAILHGNKFDPENKVCIIMNLSGNHFLVEVEDEKEGFVNKALFHLTFAENIKRYQDKGIYILRQLDAKLAFKDEGRKIFIKFTIPE